VFFVSIHLGGDWAWRVPFLASIILVIVGLIIRAKVPESPVFEDVKAEGNIVKSPIVEVVKTDWRNILRGVGLRIAETAGYAVSITSMLSYLKAPSWRPGPKPSARYASRPRSAHSPPSHGPHSPTRPAGARCTCGCAHSASHGAS
jgi:MFS family permease